MRKFYSIFALCAFLFLSVSSRAEDYMIGGFTSQSSSLPIVTGSGTFTSITQQIYLASELTDAGAAAGDINALIFSFGNNSYTVREVTRNLEIYIKLVPSSFIEFELENHKFKFVDPGSSANKVYDGNYTIPATTSSGKIERTINTSRFYWDGTSNIVLTVIDKTNKKFFSMSGDDYSDYRLKSYGFSTTTPRYVHNYWMEANASEFATYKSSLAGKSGWQVKSTDADEISNHKFVNGIKFSIVAPLPVPTSPSAGSITKNSAVLSWTAAAGADSYEVRYGTTSGSLGAATNVGNVTSHALSGLEEETTYYFQVRTKIGSEYSAWTSEASFTTLAESAHEHNGISFDKWSSTNSLPTSGNYYIKENINFAAYATEEISLTGNLNLCLNGKLVNIEGSKIIVPDGKTFTIFDYEGGGKITSFVPGEIELYENNFQATIVVKNGGTLVLKEGIVENTFARDPDDPSDDDLLSLAIYSNGTIQLSGDAQINSNDADFCLHASNVITLVGALSNVEKHSVYKNGGVFTSGWSTHMSGEDPKDFFVSARADKIVSLKDGEAALRTALNLSESSANAAIGDNYNQTVDVNLTRSLTSSQFNTFCLPFALDNAQLEEFFGAGYDLEEFVSSEIVGDELVLSFNKVTSLEAGKPYLLQPSVDVANPAFEGVTITAIAPSHEESDLYISFHGVFNPTSLEGGNKNLLFLGAGNELFWPEDTGNLKGFRAYFEVKGAAQKAKAARIVKKEDQTQAIDNIENPNPAQKRILNGQLVIEKNGTFYNAQGQIVK